MHVDLTIIRASGTITTAAERGRQNYVSSSTGKYGIGLKIRKIYTTLKKFGCGALIVFLHMSFRPFWSMRLRLGRTFFKTFNICVALLWVVSGHSAEKYKGG